MAVAGIGGKYDPEATGKLIRDVGINSFITRLGGDPRALAAENNKLQAIAEGTRLGIPLTISTDPRNHFQYVLGASVQSGGFSQWPETLGFAAIGDSGLVRRFADIARQEYRAVGIQETLSPQADLATEPRWSRINGTFGEDPELARRLVQAYVEGFQHGTNGVDSEGVLAVVKHWVGYGAQKNGLDSHSSYGKYAAASESNLERHVQPFLGAFAVHVAGVMPTYSILEGATLGGKPLEQVGAAFNRQLLSALLRTGYRFDGVILTDWGVTNDCGELCRNGFPAGKRPTFEGVAMPWGVEQLSKVDRFAKAVNAGVDQFGGTEEAGFIVDGVRAGKITAKRIDASVYRIALQKFEQGLFENPYVDTARVDRVVGNPEFQAAATAAQRRSLVLLENKEDILPLVARGKRVYLVGVDSAAATRYGFSVVSDLSQAEIAIVRANAPFQTLHPNYTFGAMQHEGDLGFHDGEPKFEEIKRISAAVPTIVTVYLDRPAILTPLKDRAAAVLGNFGVSDIALLDVLTGVAQPEGKLPFELPSTMLEVETQRSDVPHDTKHPLYRFGFGLRYKTILPATAPVGIFDAQTDVGRAKRPTPASYDSARQAYLIAGSGQNMWGDRDDFHFVWKRMTGNFILSTRARFVGAGGDVHRKIGWTIRPSLEPSAPHVTAALHGNGLTSLQFRRAAGAMTEEEKSRDSLPDADAVIQLERRDGVYVMSVARFGDTLATQQLSAVSLPDTVYVGLFVCSHNDSVVERGAFSNVRITTPAKSDLVAYRDYLGSNLEILDVASGNATIVHSYRGSFQAPNWTHDGKALIYAQEGHLYRFDLASRSPGVINTGFATRNNNDHVLSFDGRMMAISHHAVEDSGASIVYTVPTTGGTPKRVTAKGPSYFHGWSPDGRWLVYTGQRKGDFDIYKISVGGGEETRLTSTKGLDDGPEYTPDGAFIYFNSARTGRMQIWRMRPDGSGQEQITNDSFNNWFPHVSPDGNSIAFISFPLDVAADDHPFYKHVMLRLMPIGGGPSRVIAYVYGGQGTINVPSWSPDGKRLAFVSNSTMP
jgi:beta-glucosidase